MGHRQHIVQHALRAVGLQRQEYPGMPGKFGVADNLRIGRALAVEHQLMLRRVDMVRQLFGKGLKSAVAGGNADRADDPDLHALTKPSSSPTAV